MKHNTILGLSSALLGYALNPLEGIEPISLASGHTRHGKLYRGPLNVLPAGINRNTGDPHEHKREIARRARQAKRRFDTYMMNGGFTRRGNEAGPVPIPPKP